MFSVTSSAPVLKKKRNKTLLALVLIVLCFDLLLRALTYSSPNSDLSSLTEFPQISSVHFKDFYNTKPIYMIGDSAAFDSFSYETLGYSLQLNKVLYPHNELLNRGAAGFNSTLWATESLGLLHKMKNAGLVLINVGTE